MEGENEKDMLMRSIHNRNRFDFLKEKKQSKIFIFICRWHTGRETGTVNIEEEMSKEEQ